MSAPLAYHPQSALPGNTRHRRQPVALAPLVGRLVSRGLLVLGTAALSCAVALTYARHNAASAELVLPAVVWLLWRTATRTRATQRTSGLGANQAKHPS